MGLALNGAVQGFIFIPLLPEVIEAVALKYEICEGLDERLDCELNDKASAIYATFCSIGMILAPIIGGPLYDAV